MAKLTKTQAKLHREALALLDLPSLTINQREAFYQNYNEAADVEISAAGAFFTPLGMANDMLIDVPTHGSVIDICAGIGHLSFAAFHYHWHRREERETKITCIEINPRYVEIGRKVLPEATWICADALDPATYRGLGKFGAAISNPPFGNPHTYRNKAKNAGGNMEYAIIERAAKLSDHGGFIIPQMSAPFEYSGRQCYRERPSIKYETFNKRTGINLSIGAGCDTTFYKDEWKNAAPLVELAFFDFEQERWDREFADEARQSLPLPAPEAFALDLFGNTA